MIPALIYAPGERYVLAHRPRLTPAGIASTGTECALPIGDDWQALPPELCTPICGDCTAALRSRDRAPVPAVLTPAAPTPPAPLAPAPLTAAQEPPQPPHRPLPAPPAHIHAWRYLTQLWRHHNPRKNP